MAELSIRRGLFGYRKREVESLISARGAELELRASELRVHYDRIHELEAVADRLTVQVVEREREVRELREELRQAATVASVTAEPDRGLRLVETLAVRVEELHAQAREQATRIRLAGLREAAELTARLQATAAANDDGREKAVEVPIRRVPARIPEPSPAGEEINESPVLPAQSSNGGGAVLAGPMMVDVGPLADFAQLIRIEDAVKEIEAATEICIKRFSGGRATLSMHFREPVELLRELEARSDLEFVVRRTGADELVLDVAGAAASP